MVYTLGILVALLSVYSVLCKKCDLKDTDCMIVWANTIYPGIAKGGGNIRTSEILHKDLIEADLATFKYILRNADLIGMKDCVVTKLICNVESKKFDYQLQCPTIMITAEHEAKGDIAGFNIDVKGSCTITADDYEYQFSGDFDRIIGPDDKTYIRIVNYEVAGKVNGKLNMDFKNDYDGSSSDFNTVLKFINENWKDVDDILRKPAVNSFMKLFVENLNAYLSSVPFEPFVSDD